MNPAAELSNCPESDTTYQSWKSSESFAGANANLSANESPWTRTVLQIPQDDRTLFALPEMTDALDLACSNQVLLGHASIDVSGRPLSDLRESARREILELARNYTSGLVGESVAQEVSEGLLFCSGHQPALFHPGVWVKNFAVHALARHTSGVALNLVVDNDTLGSRQLRVPTGNRENPSTACIPFDDPLPAGPWEEARIQNPALFESFGTKIEQAMSDWEIEPLISKMWPTAIAQSRRSPSLRDALTAARVSQEHRWGVDNLELPLSRMCETESFLWFSAAILTRLPRFWEQYNTVLSEFRQVNRIRSQTHPVPELAEDDGWYEAPFWVWQAGDSNRRRVIAKACSREVRLSDGREIFARLPITPAGVADAVDILKELPKLGYRFRTRALTTTLFARLCLADLFVHGIGGAKYDEMTDRLISRFFGLPAPGFLTMSCTLHLPLGDAFHASLEEVQRLHQQLRDVEFTPERHLPRNTDANLDALMVEKQALIASWHASQQTRCRSAESRRENHERHSRLAEITSLLAAHTSRARKLLDDERSAVRQQVAANSVLQDREFSFALYPEEKLLSFLTSAVNPWA